MENQPQINVLTFTIDNLLRIDPASISNSSFIVNGDDQTDYFLVKVLDKTINNVSVNFLRKDGKKLGEYSLSLFDSQPDYNMFKFTFNVDTRILAVSGELGLTLILRETEALEGAYTHKRVKATPSIALLVRKAIQSNEGDLTEIQVIADRLTTDLNNLRSELNSEISRSTDKDTLHDDQIAALIADTDANTIGLANHVANKENPHETNGDNALLGVDETETIHEAITRVDDKATNTKNKVDVLEPQFNTLKDRFNTHEENTANPHGTNGENASISASDDTTIKTYVDNKTSDKLKKDFSDLLIANNISDNDFAIINKNGISYKVTILQLKAIFGGGGGEVNHYKGDFLTLEALQQAYPTAEAGDYAFVNKEDLFIQYLWDDTEPDKGWKEATSTQSVSTTTFNAFQ